MTNEKDLGVYVTDDAKPSLQCVDPAENASQALEFIKRTFTYYDRKSFTILYKTYIFSCITKSSLNKHGVLIQKRTLNA